MTSTAISRRILRAIKLLENGNKSINNASYSALLGLPQHLYSYDLSKTINIGSDTYSGFTQFLKNQMNATEYSQPIATPPPSMKDIFERYKSISKPADFGKEILNELELLSTISDKLSDQDSEQDMLHLDQHITFRHIPGNGFNTSNFKGSLMLQHPMSVSDMTTDPAVLLGLHLAGKFEECPITGDMIEVPYYQSLKLNDKSIMSVEYVAKSSDRMKDEHYIKTSHGNLIVPQVFHDEPLYFGGDQIETTEVLTTSKFCKGTPIMGAKLFWNPDLKAAKKMIEAGHAEMNQFRFFQGKMSWNQELFENICSQRNVYSAFATKSNLKAFVVPDLVDAVWVDDEQGSQWKNVLRRASSEWNEWIRLQDLMKTSDELKELKQLHRQNVCNQISFWQSKNTSHETDIVSNK